MQVLLGGIGELLPWDLTPNSPRTPRSPVIPPTTLLKSFL
jgi:hypothetical protein